MKPSLTDFPQRFPRECCAVYALVWEGEVVYVGKSVNVYGRVMRHTRNYQNYIAGKRRHENRDSSFDPIAFDDAWVRYCKRYELDDLEFRMIRKYKPKFNRQHMEVDPVVEEIRLGRKKIDLEALGWKPWMVEVDETPKYLRGFNRRV